LDLQLDVEPDGNDAATAAAASSVAASIIMSPRGMALYRPALSPLAEVNAAVAAAFSFAAADSSSTAAAGADAFNTNSTAAGATDAADNSITTESNMNGDLPSSTPPKTVDIAATANSDDAALNSAQQQQRQQQQQLRSVMSAVTAATRLNRGNGNTYHSSSAVPAKRRRIYPVGRTQARQKWATREIAALDFLTSIPMRQEAKVSY
jgi:hypothetical protein